MTVMIGPMGLNAALGIGVEKQAVCKADIDLYRVTGKVLITLIIGECVADADHGSTDIKLNEKAGTLNLCALSVCDFDNIGAMYVVTGDPVAVLNGNDAHVLHVAGHASANPHQPIFFDGQAGLTIELTQVGADATLEVLWTLFYIPLEPGANVVAL